MPNLDEQLMYKSDNTYKEVEKLPMLFNKSTSNKNYLSNNPIYREEAATTMDDNNSFILKIIDKINDDNKQLKHDIEESEKRIHNERLELDKRIGEERKLSEERMEKKFIEAMEAIKYQNEKIDKISDKIDSKIDALDTKIDSKTSEINNKIDSTNKWIIGVCITTILGIAAMVVTIIISW